MVENLTNGNTTSKNLTGSTPLCGRNAEWIVSDPVNSTLYFVPLADFGTVTFTNAVAGNHTPSDPGVTLPYIKNNKTVTASSVNGSSVTIQYVG